MKKTAFHAHFGSECQSCKAYSKAKYWSIFNSFIALESKYPTLKSYLLQKTEFQLFLPSK